MEKHGLSNKFKASMDSACKGRVCGAEEIEYTNDKSSPEVSLKACKA